MCCLCIQFTYENTSERTILHLVKKKILGLVACTAKKASYALGNDPDLVQVFLKKWWVESDFKAPNLPLSLRLKVSGCHYNSI